MRQAPSGDAGAGGRGGLTVSMWLSSLCSIFRKLLLLILFLTRLCLDTYL